MSDPTGTVVTTVESVAAYNVTQRTAMQWLRRFADATVKGTELNLGHGRGKLTLAAARQRRAFEALWRMTTGQRPTDADWQHFSGDSA